MYGLLPKITFGMLLLFTLGDQIVADEPTPATAPQVAAVEHNAAEQSKSDQGDLYKQVIRDRYPNGQIKVRREVARTVDHNYINHGECLMWDEANGFMAGGRFEVGLRVGTWKRVYREDDSALFTRPEYKDRFGPFTSQADFENGRLNGLWTMTDGENRTMFAIPLVDGLRHGTAVFYHANGEIAHETDYRNGQADGWNRTYDEQGELIAEAQFIDGRKYSVERETHLGTKATTLEAGFAYPPQKTVANDDWWTATLAQYQSTEGEPLRHGPYKAWYTTGKLRVEGTYHMGEPVGEFRWYHSDGEPAIQGQYIAGKQDGQWHWWHANGMMATEGSYRDGNRIGQWLTWQPDGAVIEVKNHSIEQHTVVQPQTTTPTDGTQPPVQLLRRSPTRQDAAQR